MRARLRTGDVSEMTIKTVPAGVETEHPRGILLRRNGSESGGLPKELETQAGSFPRDGSLGRALGVPACIVLQPGQLRSAPSERAVKEALQESPGLREGSRPTVDELAKQGWALPMYREMVVSEASRVKF